MKIYFSFSCHGPACTTIFAQADEHAPVEADLQASDVIVHLLKMGLTHCADHD